jgi:hypothetical protein
MALAQAIRLLSSIDNWLEEGTDSDTRKVIVDAANAILIGASLIASVTYASWLKI